MLISLGNQRKVVNRRRKEEEEEEEDDHLFDEETISSRSKEIYASKLDLVSFPKR